MSPALPKCPTCRVRFLPHSPKHVFCVPDCRPSTQPDYCRDATQKHRAEQPLYSRDYQRTRYSDPELREKRREYNWLFARRRRAGGWRVMGEWQWRANPPRRTE